MLPHLDERADRIRAPPLKRPSSLGGKRLREHEEPVTQIDETERRGGEKRSARSETPEEPANSRPDDEADSKSGADDAEILGALLGRTDVGDVSVGRRERSPGGTSDRPADEEPGQCGRKAHDDVIDPERADREQQDTSPTETIGQIPENRGENELHRGIHEAKPSAVDRRATESFAAELDEQPWHYGHDQPETDGVEQQRDGDER